MLTRKDVAPLQQRLLQGPPTIVLGGRPMSEGVDNPDAEFGRLATVFNKTLERLERAFENLRR